MGGNSSLDVLAWDLDHFAALVEAVSYFKPSISKNARKVPNCKLHTLSMAYQSNRKTSARKSRVMYYTCISIDKSGRGEGKGNKFSDLHCPLSKSYCLWDE